MVDPAEEEWVLIHAFYTCLLNLINSKQMYPVRKPKTYADTLVASVQNSSDDIKDN